MAEHIDTLKTMPVPDLLHVAAGASINVAASAELVAEANIHVKNVWWPQLYRSARQTGNELGVFGRSRFVEDDDMLNCMHPAIWKITNCLVLLFIKIRTIDPTIDISEWRIRYTTDENGNITILASDQTHALRVKAPKSGWVDHVMELKTLRTWRDTGDIPEELVRKSILVTSVDQETLKGMMGTMTQLSLGKTMFADFEDSEEKAPEFSIAQQSVLAIMLDEATTTPNSLDVTSSRFTKSGKSSVKPKKVHFSLPCKSATNALSKSNNEKKPTSNKQVSNENDDADKDTTETSSDWVLCDSSKVHENIEDLDPADAGYVIFEHDLDDDEPSPLGYNYKNLDSFSAQNGIVTGLRGCRI